MESSENLFRSGSSERTKKPSTELLRNTLSDWASLYGKRISEPEINVWMGIFAKTDPKILGLALQYVTENNERMPTPGSLTKAVQIIREKFPELLNIQHLTSVAGKDAKGVPCVFWSDEIGVPAYSAKNCADGRSFLILLREIAGTKSISTTERVRQPGTMQCQDCQQSYPAKDFMNHDCPNKEAQQARSEKRR